ncbi:MAG TPA: hypothetical protein VM688_09480 [Nocardioidaceae bacterium]|nr:hypothetical protein [Nocardioidaceae bacterium]
MGRNTNRDHHPAPAESPETHRRRWSAYVTVLLIVTTAGQLAVATLATSLPQFEGKAFGSRLVAYPVMMTLPVLAWWVVARYRRDRSALPWPAFACICAPFFIDVTGNTVDLYDTVVWWDDANHFVNWGLLCFGIGLMLTRTGLRQRWVLATLVTGLGALLAILWELAEWYTFIRHGTELDTAYTDTLGDEALGTLGGACAGLLLVIRHNRD